MHSLQGGCNMGVGEGWCIPNMRYKGYIGVAEYSPDRKNFSGHVLGTGVDVITFEGEGLQDLDQAFQDSIDDYLEFCEALDKVKGRASVQTGGRLVRECYVGRAPRIDATINLLAEEAYTTAQEKGFYEGVNMEDPIHQIARLGLIGTEVSEAIEEVRSERDPCGEVVDVIIRSLDFLAAMGCKNIQELVESKMRHNKLREHKHSRRL